MKVLSQYNYNYGRNFGFGNNALKEVTPYINKKINVPSFVKKGAVALATTMAVATGSAKAEGLFFTSKDSLEIAQKSADRKMFITDSMNKEIHTLESKLDSVACSYADKVIELKNKKLNDLEKVGVNSSQAEDDKKQKIVNYYDEKLKKEKKDFVYSTNLYSSKIQRQKTKKESLLQKEDIKCKEQIEKKEKIGGLIETGILLGGAFLFSLGGAIFENRVRKYIKTFREFIGKVVHANSDLQYPDNSSKEKELKNLVEVPDIPEQGNDA